MQKDEKFDGYKNNNIYLPIYIEFNSSWFKTPYEQKQNIQVYLMLLQSKL